MKINIDPVVSSRIKAAWKRLTPQQQAQITPRVQHAHQQAVHVARTRQAPAAKADSNQLILAHSAMTDDSDGVLDSLEAGEVVDVGADGVIWGTGKWQQLDPGWAEAFAVYLENIITGKKHPFVFQPQIITIPDQATIGIAGDWGTGDWRTAANPAPSTDVRKQLALLNADITIHLGDVYYAGTADQELHSFTSIWPAGAKGAFALNSNHEMYSGATPYFNAIANPPFNLQAGCSYFALQNSRWVIIGLDSAYFSTESSLYMDGALFPGGANGTPNQQYVFLQQQAAAAKASSRKVVVLSHHNGIDETGSTPNALFDQVTGSFPGGAPDYWYWGHLHAGAVYKPYGTAGVRCRCCGHGALPWGDSSDLANSTGVSWYENRFAKDPDVPQRLFNGFAVLTFDGAELLESFYDENGGIAWQSS